MMEWRGCSFMLPAYPLQSTCKRTYVRVSLNLKPQTLNLKPSTLNPATLNS